MERPHLLVIDDDEATARLFGRIAEGEGYEVRTASSGSDARAILTELQPAVIILDMIMPDMDGIEMVRWLSGQTYTGRLVLVSGFSQTYLQAAATMARAAGMATVHILQKPVSVADLREAVGPVAGG